MTDFRESIAHRLRSHRKSAGLSLDAAARATGVSKAMLGQIERQESAPTILTLWKIAKGLDISFSSFLTMEHPEPVRQPGFPNDPDMRVKVLFPFDAATRMEMFEITFTNNHHQISTAHQIGVIEHVVTLQGVLEIFYEGGWQRVSVGEAFRFHADVDHQYRGVTATTVFQNIICYTRLG